MPKVPIFKDYPSYLVIYQVKGETRIQECVGSKVAIDVYRQLRLIYGDNCRVAKLVVNYGEEV